MIIGATDKKVIESVLDALSAGLRRAENQTPDGCKVIGHYITDEKIRIEIVEKR